MTFPQSNNDFRFSDLFSKIENKIYDDLPTDYPFSRLKCYFQKRSELVSSKWYGENYFKEEQWDERIFNMFRPIFNRNDNFYLIAYRYFDSLTGKRYDYYDKKRFIINSEKVAERKTSSFFEDIYISIEKIYKDSKTQFRHEYILTQNRFRYINKLIECLIEDFSDLQKNIKENANVFAKMGLMIKEIYIEIFKDLFANYNSEISQENFKYLKRLLFPDKKELLSFQFVKELSLLERDKVIKTILKKLKYGGLIAQSTTYEQIDELFSYKRRDCEKIKWIGFIGDLFTFYKILEKNNIVQDSNDEHWFIMAEFFEDKNSNNYLPEDIKTKKLIKNKFKLECMELAFGYFIEQENLSDEAKRILTQ